MPKWTWFWTQMGRKVSRNVGPVPTWHGLSVVVMALPMQSSRQIRIAHSLLVKSGCSFRCIHWLQTSLNQFFNMKIRQKNPNHRVGYSWCIISWVMLFSVSHFAWTELCILFLSAYLQHAFVSALERCWKHFTKWEWTLMTNQDPRGNGQTFIFCLLHIEFLSKQGKLAQLEKNLISTSKYGRGSKVYRLTACLCTTILNIYHCAWQLLSGPSSAFLMSVY